MIYLILKIFLYLLLALLLGFGSGWLTRNILAARREDELQKSVTEARARVPQFESLMRSRDQQVQRLRDENGDKDQRLAELTARLQGLEEELRRKQRELGALSARGQALNELDGVAGAELRDAVEPSVAGADAAGSEALRDEVARLTTALADARAATADAVAEAAAAEAELARLRGSEAPGAPATDSAREVLELEARLRQQAEEQERLSRALQSEQRKVVELERERELQNRSLQVLHQQLELERERNGDPAAGTHASEQRAAPH